MNTHRLKLVSLCDLLNTSTASISSHNTVPVSAAQLPQNVVRACYRSDKESRLCPHPSPSSPVSPLLFFFFPTWSTFSCHHRRHCCTVHRNTELQVKNCRQFLCQFIGSRATE
ncbi:hypothetical protein JOB18_014076 [Solea senegalensis]|uniref:Secreted protein n=1 Tax=Solea senegalensis TaxID=28829 RepID=A0AAV6RSN3_SOLSE|nr:hypothetical protein JOB18_014076 [Solea senegalensis]